MRTREALYALHRATQGIAGELDIERVLQLIVDSVRELVDARYAALGIVDARGVIERFITSGMSNHTREMIGAPPSGHGLLGTIIREGAPLRIPDISRHPDTYGFPPNHPPMKSFLGVPVRSASETIGNLYLTEKIGQRQFSAGDQELVEMFALHAGIAIHNARLHQQVQDLAIVDERLRISRDLHDGIIQGIYGVTLSLEDVPELIEEDRDAAVGRVDLAIDRLNATIGDIRTFIVGLDPESGWGMARGLARLTRSLSASSTMRVELDVAPDVEEVLTPERTNGLLQIAREAVSNVARHSHARTAKVSLRVEDGAAVLRIEDDGQGFDTDRPVDGSHFGLTNLRERARGLGGDLRIDSSPGRGTRIMLTLPIAQAERPT